MNINSQQKKEDQKRIKAEMVALYNDFPFKYSFWEEKANIPTMSFGKKISEKHENRHYHFLQEELDRAKAYIQAVAPKYL